MSIAELNYSSVDLCRSIESGFQWFILIRAQSPRGYESFHRFTEPVLVTTFQDL